MEKDFEYDKGAVDEALKAIANLEDPLMSATMAVEYAIQELDAGLYGFEGPHTARMSRMLDTLVERYQKLEEWAIRVQRVIHSYEDECDARRQAEQDEYTAQRLATGMVEGLRNSR